jgi:hypothetical protein
MECLGKTCRRVTGAGGRARSGRDRARPRQKPIAFTAPISRDDGDWVVLRVTDPERPAAGGAEPFGAYSTAGRAVAYASPFFLATP